MSFFSKLKNKLFGKKDNQDEVISHIQETRQNQIEEKYEKGLLKSKESFFKKIKLFLARKREIDQEFFNEFEEMLMMADVGYDLTKQISEHIQKEVKLSNLKQPDQILDLILEQMYKIYMTDISSEEIKLNIQHGKLNVILISGVNGVGKTTSIGKILSYLHKQNYTTLVAAADTFRAGAVEQLKVWAHRTNTDIIAPEFDGQDPASVVFKSIQKAKEKNTEVLIIDTAGRLQNKQNLMNEIAKIKKIVERETGSKISETLLVIDAMTGQNGVMQAKVFNEILELTGIILTKMDSSSRGGIILAIKQILNIPVKFIGLGEGLEDLQEFDINQYLYGLTKGLIDSQEEIIPNQESNL